MKHNVTKSTSVSNTINETIDFKIGDAAVVIDILRNKLYSDKIRVVAQEYLSNARDAMREAKNKTDKIEVTLPTKKNPTLKIRDYGPGLSPERVKEVFVQFGRSTKRDSDEQTGGFGLGAKSLFAYTESAVIVSIHAGIETHYVAHLGKTAAGTLEKVYEEKTSSKAGVEIQIPVNLSKEEGNPTDDLERFQGAVYRTIAFWNKEEMPVIKNEAEAIQTEWLKIYNQVQEDVGLSGKTFAVLPRQETCGGHNTSTSMVLDGIIYEYDTDDFNSLELERFHNVVGYYHRSYLIIRPGEIEVSASREAASINQANINTLKKHAKAARAEVFDVVKSHIDSIKTLNEVVSVVKKISVCTPITRRITKKIEGVSIYFETGSLSKADGYKAANIRRRGYYSRARATIDNYADPLLTGTMIHLDAELAESTILAKLKEYSKDSNEDNHFVLIPKDLTEAAKNLNAIPISTLKSKKPHKRISLKKELAEGWISLKTLQYSWYRGASVDQIEIDLNVPVNRSFIVVPDVETKQKMDEYAALQYLLQENQVQFTFCFPTKTQAKLIASNPSFVKMEDLISAPERILGKKSFSKLAASFKATVINEGIECMPFEVSELAQHADLITDPQIKNAILFFKNYKKPKNIQIVSANVSEDGYCVALFKNSLGDASELLTFIQYYKSNAYPIGKFYDLKVLDLIYYMNGKFLTPKPTAA